MVKYRLGLDVGTASVGAAAVSLDKDGQPDALIWHHVRIFNEPLEPGQAGLVSKKAGRRKARMQRRQIDRRASRLRHIAHLSSLMGLKREEIPPDDGSTLPKLRDQAATKRVELEDLLRILLRLSKRRGYKGEFKAKKKGEVAEGSGELSLAMRTLATERNIALKDENDTGITLGQYLLHRMESGLPTKLKVNEISNEPKNKKDEDTNAPKNLYALRKMVEHEFNTIWDTQAKHHDILNGTHDGKPIREHFHEALFFQRPLKSAADLVAQCGLEPTLPRAPRAQMAFQRFRIEKTLADLRWGAGKRAVPITPDQKQTIRDLLDQNEQVKFEDIYEALKDAGCAKPLGKGLNVDRASREELLGNSTLAALRKLDTHSKKLHPERAANLENQFRALDEKIQIATINFLAEIGSPEQLHDPEWHNSFVKRDGKPRQFGELLIAFVNSIKEHDNFNRLSNMDFDGGRASYSAKALNKLADWLKEPNWPGDWDDAVDGLKSMDEEGAVRACYREQMKEKRNIKQLNKLPTPESTGSTVVDGSLRQIRWTVNKMIDELGAPPDEIVVEMAREMSLGITRRNEREKEITNNQKARREAEKAIRVHGETPIPPKVFRYLLWAEQDMSFCPYCNKTINLADALSGSATANEHIIPKKLTQIGKKRSELVLSHSACNDAKGDFTPFEAWGNGKNEMRWQSVEAAAKRFLAKALSLKKKIDIARRNDNPAPYRGEMNGLFRKAALLRLQDAGDDESVDGFADRQLHQTGWIAKEAAQWLECLCPDRVSVSRGQLTAMLRRSWKLETVIPEVRYENKLPVLDTGGKVEVTDKKEKKLPAQPITPEDFARLKKYLEGHPVLKADREANPGFDFNRRPDKRLDHRHHLIDAITLALTSRGLFQKMATSYKAAAEKIRLRDGEASEARLRLEVPEPPLLNVRAAALQAVRECNISIKHDRHPAGRMFQDFSYRVIYKDGDESARLARKKSVSDMAGDTVEQTRKNIIDIVSPSVRNIILDEFDRRKNNGKSINEIFSEPFLHPEHRAEIKKVFCLQKIGRGYLSTDGTFRVKHPLLTEKHEKRLLHDGYAYLEMKLENGNFKSAHPITQWEGQRQSAKTSEDTIRFFKSDTVMDSQSGKLYLVRQIKAQSGGMLVMAPITETLGVEKMSSDYGLQFPSGKSLARFKLV
ncbi:MAG: type II CRISPR RNA-guided endonuclease Cas9 [Gallionellaceae bacterium]|nr:type II CRISPR RNA-guided endonuclease Cas9 [Gallionellaceae bacterium]